MNKMTVENEDAARKVLDDIFDNFDFEQVKKTMDALNWKWDIGTSATPDEERFAVPTLERIKKEVARLMWDCANMDTERLAAGGFVVEKDFMDPNDPWMRLAFEVTDWDASASELDDEINE